MKHRIILCAILLLGMLILPLTPIAQAAERWEEGWNADITYEFDEVTGTVTLSGTGEMTANQHLKPWGNYPKSVKKVVVGEGITGIGAYAFTTLQNLTTVVLPTSVTSIGRCAFQSCNALTSIDISHVTSLGEYAFSGCSALSAVDISRVTSLGEYAFENSGLGSVTIPKVITEVPGRVFTGCKKLQEVILHDNITKIGYQSFQNCYRLTSLQMPKRLKELDGFAFANCTGLTDIQLNEGLEFIGHGAFSNCTALTSLVLPDSVRQVDEDAFIDCTKLQSIHLGSNLSSMPRSAVRNCSSLSTLTMSPNNANLELHNNGLYTKNPRKLVLIAPGYEGEYSVLDGTVAIGSWACDNGKITSLTIPDSVKTIEQHAFSECRKMKAVKLGNGVTEIKGYVFAWSGVTEITIPASVKKMGGGTFTGCTSLTKIVFEGLPPEVGDGVPERGDAEVYYPGYLPEWKNASVNNLGYYFTYIPDCQGRHNLRWEVIKAPTCTQTGRRSETWCIVCLETVDAEGELPLTDHKYGAWTTVTVPTTEKEGVSKRACTSCGKSEQKTLPKLNAPIPEPSTSPTTVPSLPATSMPPIEQPTEPLPTTPSIPKETVIPSQTEPDAAEESAPSHWHAVITVAVASILIGMAISFLIFTFKKIKKRNSTNNEDR